MLSAAAALGVYNAQQHNKDKRQRIAFTIWINTPAGLRTAYCLLDSGAESSFIQQRWAKQHLPDVDSPVRQVKAINDTFIKSYGRRETQITVGDAEGAVRDHTDRKSVV